MKHDIVKQFLIGSGNKSELLWQRECHQEVWNINESFPLFVKPFFSLIVLALGAISIHAGVIFVSNLVMLRTMINLSTHFFSPTTNNVEDSFFMRVEYAIAEFRQVGFAIPTKDVGHH